MEKSRDNIFLSFVLLSEKHFDLKVFVEDFKKEWGIEIQEKEASQDSQTLVFDMDGMMASVAFMPTPIPNEEAVNDAKTNFRWTGAIEAAKEHKSHVVIAVLPNGKESKEAGIAMVKVASSVLKQKNASGINTLGTVLPPSFYIDCAESFIKKGLFPLMNLVFFGAYTQDDGKTFSAYTYGLGQFHKEEIEIINSKKEPEEILNFLVDIASYVIDEDVCLKAGETIGSSEDEKLSIEKSQAVAVEGESLKIGF